MEEAVNPEVHGGSDTIGLGDALERDAHETTSLLQFERTIRRETAPFGVMSRAK